jgi:uncharacterized membrane protein
VAATSSTAFAEPRARSAPEVTTSWVGWELAGLVLVTAVGFLLRVNGYDRAPLFMDNADEVQFAWAGLNMILHGDPVTWSYFPAYGRPDELSAYGTTFPIVHHWLDHPPLFSLIVGGWIWLLGVRDMVDVSPLQVRVLPVLFSTVTIPLAQVLGRPLLGRRAALLGALLLATAPGAVLLGRNTEPESLQAVLLLVALLLTMRAVRAGVGPWSVAALLACCLAAPLLKVSGLAIGGTCAVILAAGGRWRLAAWVAGVTVLALVGYVVYGALVDWQLFTRVIAGQATNRIGVMAGFDFITSPSGINRRLRDGWWLLGWIGFGLMLARGRRWRELFLVWPAAAYVVTMVVLAGERQVEQYGWYRVMLLPEVYLGAGWLAWEAIRRRSLALLTLLLALGGATATNWWLEGTTTGWVPNPVFLAVLLLAVLAPAALLTLRRVEWPTLQRWALWASGIALAIVLAGNTIESLFIDLIFARL